MDIRISGHQMDTGAALQEHAAERDRSREVPAEIVDLYSNSGLWGITVPKEYGGAQVSLAVLAQVIAIISAADPALGQIPQNQFGIINLVLGSATEEQKKQLFQSVLEGWRIGNAGPERGTKNNLELKARGGHGARCADLGDRPSRAL